MAVRPRGGRDRCLAGLGSAAPDELAASLLLRVAGEVEQPPTVDLFGTLLGTERDAAELLDDLVARAGVDPESDFRRQMSFAETRAYWADLGAPTRSTRNRTARRRFRCTPTSSPSSSGRQPPADTIAALVANLAEGRVPGQSRELDFTPWAGAYNRLEEDATAFAHRDELFLLKHAVTVDADAATAEKEAAKRWVTRSWSSVRPWGSGRVFPNFPDLDLPDRDLPTTGRTTSGCYVSSDDTTRTTSSAFINPFRPAVRDRRPGGRC